MSGGAKMKCSVCGKDISMAGSPMCPICDPDVMAIFTGERQTKTPDLCEACFEKHVAAHWDERKMES